MYKAFDLFSGCGGLTLGLKQAGFSVLGAVEVDDLAAETYRTNHPEVCHFKGDVRSFSPLDIMGKVGLRKGELDLLAGCPPCQGFSTLRTRNKTSSVEDDRNDLLYEFTKFVKYMKPKAVIMENVPGLMKDERLHRFMTEVETLGYIGQAKTLNAAAYGVPQRRRRMIFMAGLGGEIPFAQELSYRFTVGDYIGGLPVPGDSGDPLHDAPENRGRKIKALIAKIPKDGGSRGDLPDNDQLPCHRRCNGFKDVYGRMSWNDVSPTITGGCINPSKGRFLHPEQNRSITLREAAILQGFPRNYYFSLRRGKYPAAQMIGNAFPPGFVRQQAMQVAKYLGGKTNE